MSRIFPENNLSGSQIRGESIDMTENNVIDTNASSYQSTNMSQNQFISIPLSNQERTSSTNEQKSTNQISAFINFLKSSFRNSSGSNHHNEVNSNNPKKSTEVKSKTPPIKLGSNVTSSHDNSSSNSNNGQSSSSNEIFCRFCQEFEPENELVSPCLCRGTLKYIHQSCLQRWIKTQDNRFCELCKYEFHMKITSKPFREWQKLEMNSMERRKIICSVTFHVIALTCVIWSLYVLIERTTEEMRNGMLEWPFWTKLIVVAIGFIGGVVFMYVQCRMYVVLCRKWHDFNRTFIVQTITPAELEAAQADRIKSQIKQHQQRQNMTDMPESQDIPTNIPITTEPSTGGGDITTMVAVNNNSNYNNLHQVIAINEPLGHNSNNNCNMTGLAPIATTNNQDLSVSFVSRSDSMTTQNSQQQHPTNQL